ncbi:MAG TPA: alpha/beta hydrolase, partial [Anaeromyxobacteraceae bacterium]
QRVHDAIPSSRIEIFPGAGHYPHLDDPERFATMLLDFIRTTQPQPVDAARLRNCLRAGPRVPSAQ